jgi:hypothetical protein
LNKLLAMNAFHQHENGTEYFAESITLCSLLASTPSIDITPGLYTLVCRIWWVLVDKTIDIDYQVKATTECLRRQEIFASDKTFLKTLR